jgi:hypothetical protein
VLPRKRKARRAGREEPITKTAIGVTLSEWRHLPGIHVTKNQAPLVVFRNDILKYGVE